MKSISDAAAAEKGGQADCEDSCLGTSSEWVGRAGKQSVSYTIALAPVLKSQRRLSFQAHLFKSCNVCKESL